MSTANSKLEIYLFRDHFIFVDLWSLLLNNLVPIQDVVNLVLSLTLSYTRRSLSLSFSLFRLSQSPLHLSSAPLSLPHSESSHNLSVTQHLFLSHYQTQLMLQIATVFEKLQVPLNSVARYRVYSPCQKWFRYFKALILVQHMYITANGNEIANPTWIINDIWKKDKLSTRTQFKPVFHSSSKDTYPECNYSMMFLQYLENALFFFQV